MKKGNFLKVFAVMTLNLAVILFTFIFTISASAQAPSIQWQKSYGSTNTEEATSIQQTKDGGYIVAGFSDINGGDVTGNHGGPDYWIVKLDSNGNIQWQKSLGGSMYDIAHSIQQTTDGGYIVAGESHSFDGDVTGNHYGTYDYWVVKLDTIGNIQWQKSLGGAGSGYGDDKAYSVKQTSDEGYIVAGFANSADGDITGHHGVTKTGISNDKPDYWVVKLDASGNIQWEKSLGGTDNDIAYSIEQTTDGGYIVAGESNSIDYDVTNNIYASSGSAFWIVN